MKLSVCVPTYKSLEYIDEALQSVLSQSFTDFEVIIGNDSPSDNEVLREKIKGYNDPRLKFYPNETNLGYPLNMRSCVEKATNEILFLMAQDDTLLSNRLFDNIVDIFSQNPEVGVITRPYYWFEDDIRQPALDDPHRER